MVYYHWYCLKNDEEKSQYLKDLFKQTYIKDIIEPNNVQRIDAINSIINILTSAVGLLKNPISMILFLVNGNIYGKI